MVIKKKGISSVVATVGLVLLTVVAVTILVAFVVPFVRDNLNESTSCLNYREYFSFNEKFNFNCYDISGEQKLYKLSVGAKTAESLIGENVEGFKLVFYSNDNSITKDVNEDDISSTLGGEIFMQGENGNIKIPKPGETRTYVYTTNGAFSKAEIYVKLKSGKVCSEMSDSVTLGKCD